jgi:hypothetical protein
MFPPALLSCQSVKSRVGLLGFSYANSVGRLAELGRGSLARWVELSKFLHNIVGRHDLREDVYTGFLLWREEVLLVWS